VTEGKLTDDEFIDKVIGPLKNVMWHVYVAQVVIVFLDCTDVLFRRVPLSMRPKFISPVLFALIKSTDDDLNDHFLVLLPFFQSTLEEDTAGNLICGVAQLLEGTSKDGVALSAIQVMDVSILNIGPWAVAEIAARSIF
jgi:hypothetical protein